jgi:hypothetical protein
MEQEVNYKQVRIRKWRTLPIYNQLQVIRPHKELNIIK